MCIREIGTGNPESHPALSRKITLRSNLPVLIKPNTKPEDMGTLSVSNFPACRNLNYFIITIIIF